MSEEKEDESRCSHLVNVILFRWEGALYISSSGLRPGYRISFEAVGYNCANCQHTITVQSDNTRGDFRTQSGRYSIVDLS